MVDDKDCTMSDDALEAKWRAEREYGKWLLEKAHSLASQRGSRNPSGGVRITAEHINAIHCVREFAIEEAG